MVKRLSTLVVAALGVGCVDAERAYDDYATRVVDAGAPPTVECPSPGGVPNITGTWLYGGLAVPGQAQDIRFLVDFAFTPAEGGGGTVDVSMQPLRTADAMPTGTPLVATGVAVNACGRFVAPVVGPLPADANPVVPIALDLAAMNDYGIFSETFGCGNLSGTATNTGTALMGMFAIQKVDPTQPLPESKNDCSDGGI